MLVIKNLLKETKHKGIGLFAGEDIKKGTVIWVDNDDFEKTFPAKSLDNYPLAVQDFITTYGEYNKEKDCWYLDCDNSRFMNHSSNPNIEYNSSEKTMVALRDISFGDELLCDYRTFCDENKYEGFSYEINEDVEKFDLSELS